MATANSVARAFEQHAVKLKKTAYRVARAFNRLANCVCRLSHHLHVTAAHGSHLKKYIYIHAFYVHIETYTLCMHVVKPVSSPEIAKLSVGGPIPENAKLSDAGSPPEDAELSRAVGTGWYRNLQHSSDSKSQRIPGVIPPGPPPDPDGPHGSPPRKTHPPTHFFDAHNVLVCIPLDFYNSSVAILAQDMFCSSRQKG